MVLIWTQFGVKHKNVKCKVRVMHSDESWSSEEAREEPEVPSPPLSPKCVDYYAVLGVSNDSNEEEIRRAYKRLALRYHPDKNPDADAEEKFKVIAQAYDVLTDPQKRSAYDQQGTAKGGVASTGSKGDSSHSSSKAESHSWRVFFNFEFDSDDDLFNPFLRTPLPNLSRHHGPGAGRVPAGAAEVHEFHVTLEEVFAGVTKQVKVTRMRPGPDKHTLRPEERVITLEVKKGWKEGTRITFPREGHQVPGHAPNDLAFVLKEKKHAHFRRQGSNLIYTATITLREALCGCTVNVPTIDGQTKPLPCSDVIKPGSVRSLRGEGLPRAKCATQRGDLLVEFQVIFPDRIPAPSKEIIKHSLGQC